MYGAVILAAGASTRMGAPKALTKVGRQPAVTRLCRILNDAGVEDIAVVVGADEEAIAPEVPVPARVVANPRWQRGRTGSIKVGVRALPPGAPLLIWPVDHPGVRLPAVKALLAARGVIRVPTFEGKRGHPSLFGMEVRDEILRLGDDQPLHDVLHADAARVVEVPVDDPAILLNVDTPGDLKRMEELLGAANARPPA